MVVFPTVLNVRRNDAYRYMNWLILLLVAFNLAMSLLGAVLTVLNVPRNDAYRCMDWRILLSVALSLAKIISVVFSMDWRCLRPSTCSTRRTLP